MHNFMMTSTYSGTRRAYHSIFSMGSCEQTEHLVVCYPFIGIRQEIVFFYLTMLLFVARMCYLLKLTHLRWQGVADIADMEVSDEHGVM